MSPRFQGGHWLSSEDTDTVHVGSLFQGVIAAAITLVIGENFF